MYEVKSALIMTEAAKIVRSTDLSLLGINQEDLDTRGVVAVGYSRGELLPPYMGTHHQERATSILEYFGSAKHKATRRLVGDLSPEEMQAYFADLKVIEVVGLFADFCVPVAIQSITSQGRLAYIESQRVFSFSTVSWKSDYPDFTFGRMVMRKTLWRPERRCQIIGKERFIYS